MTIGIGFLNQKGIVLAADSRIADGCGKAICDDAQKLFRLDGNCGVVIGGCSPYEFNESIHIPIKQTTDRLEKDSPGIATRRQTVLCALAESIRDYFDQSAQDYPTEHCRIDVILGDYDGVQGYLLLKCSFQYRPTPEHQDKSLEESQDTAEIYRVFPTDDPEFSARCCHPYKTSPGEPVFAILSIGVVGEDRLMNEYLVPCC